MGSDRKRNDRKNVFLSEVFVMSVRVMMTVAGEDMNTQVNVVFEYSLEESVKGFERECKIAFVSARHDGKKG